MSDYIAALRQDLVEAAERQQRHSPAARVARPLLPRSWSPNAVLGVGAALAALLLLVITLRAVSPPRPPEAPKVVGTFHIGGQPYDAVAAGEHVVMADETGRLMLVEPGRTELLVRGEAGAQPLSLAADGTALWVVRSPSRPLGGSELMKLDPGTGRRLGGGPLHGEAGSIALGAGGLWMITDVGSVLVGGREFVGLEKLDPRTGKRVLVLPNAGVEGLAASSRSVWTRRGATVTERDERGRVRTRVRGISPTVGFHGQRTLLADDDGAWVAGQSDGLLYRIERGRIVRRLRVGLLAGVVARTRSAVWVTASVGADSYELVRVDPDDGEVTGRVLIGRDEPQTVVPIGKELWVITMRGDVVRVSQG
jgi:hypothetical protein